ncbi:MAG: alpha/beta hydrolase [Proteobacteria bacterium]|nr:alpha/beta hydrolase [Pseudomonadota bacterium]
MQLEVITEEPESNKRSTPILFVHGFWHAAWCWSEHFLPEFAQNGYVSCALSLRGHGKSRGPRKITWITLADFLEDVGQVIDQFESPPILVGHSMGGMIIQKYLESHRVPAVVLLASAPPHGSINAVFQMITRYPLVFLKSNLSLSPYYIVAEPSRYRDIMFSKNLPEERLLEYHSRLIDDSCRALLDMTILDLPRPRKIDPPPMLVLGGADDMLVSSREVEKTARTYGAETQIFPGMGHGMMLDVGWQGVAGRIMEWLNKQGL